MAIVDQLFIDVRISRAPYVMQNNFSWLVKCRLIRKQNDWKEARICEDPMQHVNTEVSQHVLSFNFSYWTIYALYADRCRTLCSVIHGTCKSLCTWLMHSSFLEYTGDMFDLLVINSHAHLQICCIHSIPSPVAKNEIFTYHTSICAHCWADSILFLKTAKLHTRKADTSKICNETLWVFLHNVTNCTHSAIIIFQHWCSEMGEFDRNILYHFKVNPQENACVTSVAVLFIL